jgi:SAM-dependent methyltransferase
MLRFLRERRVDRMTDRMARKPHGKGARATYGAPDVHSFAWPPVLEALALGPDDSLLDVGCGGGVFMRHARDTTGCAVRGVDHSREMVRLAGPDAVLADAAQLPFDDDSFTAASSIVAFFFFPDSVAVLRELRRVLDPEAGPIAIFTTAPEAKGSPAAPYPLATRGNFYDDEALVALAREAGFRGAHLAFREPWAQLLTAHV